MKIRTFVKIVMMLAVLSFIWGCGSGGVQGTTNKVAAKSTLAGALSPKVMGVEITLVLPAGVTVKTDASGMTLAGVVTTVAPNDVTAANGSVLAKYTPASGTVPGKVKIVVARGSTPFVPGAFFTVVCDVEAGKSVTATDFTCEGLNAFDASGAVVPATWSISTGATPITGGATSTTGGTGTATSAQTALAAGFYDFNYSSYNAGTSLATAYAITTVSLATGSNSLTETWSYWDKTNKVWSATAPAGLPPGTFNSGNDYYLTASGWVAGSSGPQSYTIVFNADGTAVITNKIDGSQAKISVTATDISGQPFSTALANTSATLFPLNSTPPPPLPAGSLRYSMTFDQITDSYNVWGYSSIGTSTTQLSDVPTIFAEGNSTSQQVYIDSNSPGVFFYAKFGAGNSVNIYKQTYTATSTLSTPVVIGTATWAYKTVSGQQLLMITIPQTLRTANKFGWDPFFAVVNGGVREGAYQIGGQTSYVNGGTSYNKAVADYVVANFNASLAKPIIGEAISKTILGL